MTTNGIKSGFAFARSPIILSSSFAVDEFDQFGGNFYIEMDGGKIYEGRFSPPLNVNISEIVDAYVPFFPEPLDANTDIIKVMEDEADFECRKAYFHAEYESYEDEAEIMIIPGGLSKQNFKRYRSKNIDVFENRFFNPKKNFFLTTRTTEWRIVMKETEVFPLYFILRPSYTRMDIVETTTGQTLSFDDLEPGVMALDIDRLRLQFFNEFNVLPSIFDIYLAGEYSCRIVVEASDISKERYRLKFRNSLGVFEIIELTGELSFTPDYSEAEDASFKRYDSVTGDFYTVRNRIERKQSLSVETGTKRADELTYIMDMLGSEEVYLLDLTDLPVRVIPTVEDFEFKNRPTEPQTFSINLEIADSETNIMQDIIDGTEGRKPRVFSKQFSKQFN